MWITNSIEVRWGDSDSEILLGLHHQVFAGTAVDENEEPIIDADPIILNRFLIGLLIFNIGIFYK